jgi:hypothetical protein
MNEAMQGLILASLASGCISFTVSEANIFRPLRNKIKNTSKFLGELVSCGYCLGHWVCFSIEIIYRFNVFNRVPVLDEVLTAFIMVFGSAMTWLTINILCRISNK